MSVEARLAANAALVEAYLADLTAADDPDFAPEPEAERYSLLSRAKRVRPTLVLEFCRLYGGRDEAALPLAAAVEMVHTYSLIHDDLPAMDNDDLRRGRPTCHKAFGEATALLAGDGLLTRAFGVIAEAKTLPDGAVRAAVAALSRAAGSFGMIGGQMMDLRGEKEQLSLADLYKLHAGKTGAMIAVSAELGCIAAGLDRADPRVTAARTFAAGVGLAFQIVDDVLDATQSAETLGKSASDAARHKTTFLTYFTPAEAREKAREETQRAKRALRGAGDTAFLTAFADYLTERTF